ncbi:MAG: VanZ family protein [Faecousia sp.]
MLQMMQAVYVWFYALNLWKAIAIALTAVLLWSLLGVMLRKRHGKLWRLLNLVALAAAITVISHATLFRTETGRNLILQPFYTWIRAQENQEAYRELLMNVILFVPFGLTMPHILPQRWKTGNRVGLTIAFGFTFSVALEFAQYLFCVGTTETDDVLSNTLGVLAGMLQLPVFVLMQRAFYKKKE